MKFVLIGYGKMGREVESVATGRGHEVIGRLTSRDRGALNRDTLAGADAAIEFTEPGAAEANLLACIDAGVPVVTGTTGWYDRLQEVRDACLEKNGTLLYASNFSIGVNMLFDLNRRLATLMDNQPDYRPAIEESHHVHKLDKPSGTALTLAGDMISAIGRIDRWTPDTEKPGADAVGVRSVREGEVTGIHQVSYTSTVDRIEIRHEAYNRGGFATGAVLATEWAASRKGFYSMRDFLESLTQV